MVTTFRITRMRPEPAAIERVAELRHAAFFTGSDRTLALDRDALWRLAARNDDDELGFIAEAKGSVVGAGLLVGRELEQHHDVGPWLAGLVVRADWRSQGVGAALVRAIEDQAYRNGLAELFLYTYDTERFYRGLGWTLRESFADRRGERCALMVRALTAAGPDDAEPDDDR
jgi:predicted N-acetyltransferase YhbS